MLGTVGTETAQLDVYHTTATSGANAGIRAENISTFTSGNSVNMWGVVGKSMPSITSGTLTGDNAGGIFEGVINNAACAGTINSLYGTYALVGINAAGAGCHVANAYGVFVYCQKIAETIDEYYGVFINAPVGGGTLTSGHGIYDNSGLRSYIKGNFGCGTVDALYPLDVTGYSYLRGSAGIGVLPSDTNRLYVSATSTDAGYTTMRNEMTAIDSTDGERYYYGCTNDCNRSVASGKRATGYLTALYNLSYRNGSTTANAGSLYTLIGSDNLVGHGPSCNAGAHTDNIIGLQITPWLYAGTVDNYYGILLNGQAGAVAPTAKFSIYDNTGFLAYFKYRIGVNSNAPGCALHVVGDAFFPDDYRIQFGNTAASPDCYIEHDTAATPATSFSKRKS
jgi:hypothetical protein